MDTELKFEQLQCCDLLMKAVTTHEEAMETTLPDYCAPASRILDAAGQLLVREKQPGEGIVRGEVRVSVLYLSEESDGLQSVTVMVPFTCELSDPKLWECQLLQIHSRLLLCEAKPVTGRKIYLRVIPEMTVLGYGRKTLRLCCGAEGKGLQLRQKKQQLSLLSMVEERSCTTAQEFDIGPNGAEEINFTSLQAARGANFGWPCDEVGHQQRPNDYTAIDDPLAVFAPNVLICFFGHTHEQRVFEVDGDRVSEPFARGPDEPPATAALRPDREYFVNPGSVDAARKRSEELGRG